MAELALDLSPAFSAAGVFHAEIPDKATDTPGQPAASFFCVQPRLRLTLSGARLESIGRLAQTPEIENTGLKSNPLKLAALGSTCTICVKHAAQTRNFQEVNRT
jgi:hypothetical protein